MFFFETLLYFYISCFTVSSFPKAVVSQVVTASVKCMACKYNFCQDSDFKYFAGIKFDEFRKLIASQQFFGN